MLALSFRALTITFKFTARQAKSYVRLCHLHKRLHIISGDYYNKAQNFTDISEQLDVVALNNYPYGRRSRATSWNMAKLLRNSTKLRLLLINIFGLPNSSSVRAYHYGLFAASDSATLVMASDVAWCNNLIYFAGARLPKVWSSFVMAYLIRIIKMDRAIMK